MPPNHRPASFRNLSLTSCTCTELCPARSIQEAGPVSLSPGTHLHGAVSFMQHPGGSTYLCPLLQQHAKVSDTCFASVSWHQLRQKLCRCWNRTSHLVESSWVLGCSESGSSGPLSCVMPVSPFLCKSLTSCQTQWQVLKTSRCSPSSWCSKHQITLVGCFSICEGALAETPHSRKILFDFLG